MWLRSMKKLLDITSVRGPLLTKVDVGISFSVSSTRVEYAITSSGVRYADLSPVIAPRCIGRGLKEMEGGGFGAEKETFALSRKYWRNALELEKESEI
jgi:hypothetical protein